MHHMSTRIAQYHVHPTPGVLHSHLYTQPFHTTQPCQQWIKWWWPRHRAQCGRQWQTPFPAIVRGTRGGSTDDYASTYYKNDRLYRCGGVDDDAGVRVRACKRGPSCYKWSCSLFFGVCFHNVWFSSGSILIYNFAVAHISLACLCPHCMVMLLQHLQLHNETPMYHHVPI